MYTKYPHIAVAAGLLLLCAVATGGEWRGTTQLHTLTEVVATLLALVVGVVALVRY